MKLTTSLLAAAALAAAAVLAPAHAQTPMKISISIGQNSHQGIAIDTFAREVERRTNGRIKVQPFYSGALGGERESIEAVQLGTQELTFSSTGPVPNFVPAARILDIPFLFRDKAHARAVLDGPIGQEMLKEFESKGFKALGWAENGVRHMTNSKRAVNTPDDLKGLKMRTMENPVHVAAYKGFGIITTPMAFPEVFTALQQGTVDGQENPIPVIVANNLNQVQRHLTLTGHVYSPAVLMVSPAVMGRLSAADREAFMEAARAAQRANRERVSTDEATGVEELRRRGMTVVTEVDRSRFQAALGPAYQVYARELDGALLERIRTWRPN